ncbi:hypothetical protein ACM1TL_16275 [Lysinibacillus capsici]|uniref:hypothetical protein n=1 Tax=Lysinibacillus TaxID=400634 RepID=UPI000824D35D|nr:MULTISPECIES: hypothetical protein [Lysinibacillus]MDP1395016.1 hypothetical protein [Lysinibacillus capsici]MDP1415485.1 hypothetical protein [Lysinibacillus capsici]MDP1431379.1 hypothetical protein [Lysinibacillus capsici]OCX60684.1 hypothetical protein BFM98_02520 [Lysinibacillus sp. AR18-8]RDV34602.1 hypothetical protein C7B89_02855 [Lysinibacillus capsici]
MEESKLYTTQEIENLKEKIESYRESLTSLKMGKSIEDFLYMKQEFDGLKTQMAHLEGITETLDTKQNSYIKGYDDQIRVLSTQLESLNQTIEGMNQEILSILNKLLPVKGNDAKTIMPSIDMPAQTYSNLLPRQPRMTQTADQTTITSAQPSYRLLQSVAGKAKNHQPNVNIGGPSPQNGLPETKPEERHFNQQYFQSINTHPSQIYNGLYRNTTVESTFHFKNAMDAKEVPVSVYDPSAVQPASREENIENDTLQSSIVNESDSTKTETLNNPMEAVKIENEHNNLENPIVTNESIEQVILEQLSEPVSQDIEAIASEPLNQIIAETVAEPSAIDHSPSLETEEYVEVYHADATYEVHLSFEEEIMQLESVNKPIEEDHKKGKNSFFDFFKRWS